MLISKNKAFSYYDDVLIFTHIPKCGGTSIHDYLNKVLEESYIHFFPGSYENLDLKRYTGGGGHQKFGSNPLCEIRKNVKYITVLREPVSRFFSFYNHVANHKEHHLHSLYLKAEGPYEFAVSCWDSKNYEIANLQTKMITGSDNSTWEDAAINIRENFSVVGCVENLDVFISEVSALLKVDREGLKSLNQGCALKRYDKEKENVINFIEYINDQDVQLYKKFFG